MAKLIVTMADNNVTEIEITPRLEYAFELYAKKGFHKAFRDDEKQSDVYWLACEVHNLSAALLPIESKTARNRVDANARLRQSSRSIN